MNPKQTRPPAAPAMRRSLRRVKRSRKEALEEAKAFAKLAAWANGQW
jgi:hypothetical protein